MSQQDAAEIIVNGVEDGEWAILVGDDAEAIDQGVRSLPLGGVYPRSFDQDEMGSFSLSLAQQGDPSYFEGRQTQLVRRKAKL